MYIRSLIIVLLSGIFLKFFGLKSFNRYLSGGVMIVRTQRYPTDVDAPAIFVCPRNAENEKHGWKRNFTRLQIISLEMCKDAMNTEELYDCIELYTYPIEEVIIKAEDSEDESAWEEQFGFLPRGRCYMLTLDAQANGFSNKILKLNPTLAFYVMIWDPKFYLMTANPKTIPRIFLSLDKNCGEKSDLH